MGRAGSSSEEVDTAAIGSLRVDRWLWFARFFKTRTLAATMVTEGKVRLDGARLAKPSTQIRCGQVLTFPQGGHVRVIRIIQLGDRRGPAPEAQSLYEDLQPPTPEARLPRDPLGPAPPRRDKGAGRPTKKDRRALDHWESDLS